jgi:hypothetical protein
MERRHDLGSAGPTRTRMPSRAQRVPTGAVMTRGQHASGQKRTESNGAESSKVRRVSLRHARGKLIALAVLLALWGVIVWSRSPGQTAPRDAAGSAAVKDRRGVSMKAETLPRLKLELRADRHEPYVPAAVNLFREPPQPPAQPPVVAVRPAEPPLPPPPDPFIEAAKQLRFVGFLKSDAATAAIITRGAQLFIAASGDTVAERFRVTSVQEDTVSLASPEGDKQVRLTLASAAGAGAASSATVNPSKEGGQAEAATAGAVVTRGQPATAQPAPVPAVLIRSRVERSEMYRARAQTLQQ